MTSAPIDTGNTNGDGGSCAASTSRTCRAGDTDYETVGIGYAVRRRPDPRIAEQLWAALGDAKTVLNVGAGSGSYEPTDRWVVAVEPSPTMRGQRPADRAPAVAATAENLPFDDGSFDAVMAVLTVHHWTDLDRGLQELRRVSRGPVVVMTFDPTALERFWLAEYAPELYTVERSRFPPLEHIGSVLGGNISTAPVPIPLDCTDGVAEAFYGRPEALLDGSVRRAQSGWSFLDATVEQSAVDRLRNDLEDGTWDRRHGHLRTQQQFTGAVHLVVANPPVDSAPNR